MFIDQVRVFAQAGHGGKGCVAFHREAFRPKGGPSGGNGGRGGSVILQADHDLNNLINQFYQPRLIAQPGQQGMGKGMDGHAGKDQIVKVPCGTLIWSLQQSISADSPPPDATPAAPPRQPRAVLRHAAGGAALEMDLSEEAPTAETTRQYEKNELIADLTQHGQTFVLCQGGRGGKGNRHFATAAHQTPRFAQPGEPGSEGTFLLELRLIAEVGLVGYPNAGKSTLLTAISKAHPKVAAYPFTTLTPKIGIVEYSDWARLTVCDVPGLIEGAHCNVGLGHAFLRHIQRCKLLVLLLDMAGSDGRLPWDDYRQLLHELELYNPAVLEKPRLVVANKMDEPAAKENLTKFKRRIRKTPVLPISAAFDEGVDRFKQTIREAVEKAQAEPISE